MPLPFLWFNDQASDAAKHYVATFKAMKRKATVDEVTKYPKAAPPPIGGKVMSVQVTLEGQRLVLFNGGGHYTLTPAFSLSVSCKSQEEIDGFWRRLGDGGVEQSCGWLVDRFGVSWQIVPHNIQALIAVPAAMNAMLSMKKIDMVTLVDKAGAAPRPRRAAPKKAGAKSTKKTTPKTTRKKPAKKAG